MEFCRICQEEFILFSVICSWNYYYSLYPSYFSLHFHSPFPVIVLIFLTSIFSDYQKFLKTNTSLLVQKVKNVDAIIDELDWHDELIANVKAQPTRQKKMRELLDCVNCESIAKDLVNALFKHEERAFLSELQL